jgi:hypothetical protein
MKTAQGARAMTKRKAGRPRIEFDLEIVEGLGRIGATAAEMANVLPASQSTIEHRLADPETDFSKSYRKGQGLLKASIRRKQIAVGLAGNVTMLIWLGKQHLGQQDRLQQETVDYTPLLRHWAENDRDALRRIANGVHPEVILRERAGLAGGRR